MMKLSALNTISFTASKEKTSSTRKMTDEEKKEAAKKAVEGGGAVAATSAFSGKKAGMDLFTKAEKASAELKKGSETIKVVGETATKTKSLWGRCSQAVRNTKNSIIEWGASVKTWKIFKPLLQSRAFRFCAGALGYGFGLVTLITGLGDIVSVTSDTLSKNLIKNKEK